MGLRNALTRLAVYLGLMEEPVRNLDPKIDEFARMAMLHGLADDERMIVSTTPGEWVGWTDNYGNYDEMQVQTQGVEVTTFVRHRLRVLQAKP